MGMRCIRRLTTVPIRFWAYDGRNRNRRHLSTTDSPAMLTTTRSARQLIRRNAENIRYPTPLHRAMSSTTSLDSLVDFGTQHVTRGLGRVQNAIVTSGEGSYVNLHDGRRMLDFTTGIAVTSLGE